jgi:6-pyruvoyltetrahydropterin/6-carboxytetrahydropterin synthase
MINFPAHAPVSLRRTVRLAVPVAVGGFGGSVQGTPSGAAVSTASSWRAHHDIVAECRGEPDARTGYLLGIQEIDAAVRSGAAPLLEGWLSGAGQRPEPHAAVAELAAATQRSLPAGIRLQALAWWPGPLASIAWNADMPDHAILSQRFEFSASHRLHCPDRSEEENRRLFGKCNNPNGHGHNYRIEVSLRVPAGPGATPFPEDRLERIARHEVVDRFDHKHLNVDCPEFAQLNPSVENIVRVCHALLEPAFRTEGAELFRVTVWETEKTSATFPVR